MSKFAKLSAYDQIAALPSRWRGTPDKLLQNCKSSAENRTNPPDNLKSADDRNADALPLADHPCCALARLGSAGRHGIRRMCGNPFEDMQMGRVIWISGACVAVALLVGAGIAGDPYEQVETASVADSYAEPDVGSAAELELGDTGSALASAAFGLSALQPETFNGEIVRNIIEASPLAYSEKDRLVAKLISAQAGRGELPRVLEDIRVSLAVE